MTVSSYVPSDASVSPSRTSIPLHRRIPLAVWLAALYLLAHLPFLAPSLEDYDSINFGLALHEYDIAKAQPHPPGYPVYIAAGRAVLAVLRVLSPGLDSIRADAMALSGLSAITGALALA